LVGALTRFWWRKGYAQEGRFWTNAFLDPIDVKGEHVDMTGATAEQKLAYITTHAKVLQGSGLLAQSQGDYDAASALYEKSHALWKELGDKPNIAGVLNVLGSVARDQGNYDVAQMRHQEALAIYRALSDLMNIGVCLSHLGVVAFFKGDGDTSEKLHFEAIQVRRQIGDSLGIAGSLINLGTLAFYCKGDFVASQKYCSDSLDIRLILGDEWGIALCKCLLGLCARKIGNSADSFKLAIEGLSIFMKMGDKLGIAEGLEGLAVIYVEERNFDTAGLMFGTAERIREDIKTPLPRPKLKFLQTVRENVKEFGIEWDVVLKKGKETPIEQVTFLALQQKR